MGFGNNPRTHTQGIWFSVVFDSHLNPILFSGNLTKRMALSPLIKYTIALLNIYPLLLAIGCTHYYSPLLFRAKLDALCGCNKEQNPYLG